MPKVAALLNESVLVLTLNVVGSTGTTELGALLVTGASLTLLGMEILVLEVGGEEEGVSLATVTIGGAGGGGGAEEVGVLSVVETEIDDSGS